MKILKYGQKNRVAGWEWKSTMIYVNKSCRILKEFYSQSLPFHHCMFWVPLSLDAVKNRSVKKNFFPAIHSFPNFSPILGIQTSAEVSLGTTEALPLVVQQENCLFTLALEPKKSFWVYHWSRYLSPFYRHGNSLTEVKQLTSSKHPSQEYRIWPHSTKR